MMRNADFNSSRLFRRTRGMMLMMTEVSWEEGQEKKVCFNFQQGGWIKASAMLNDLDGQTQHSALAGFLLDERRR